MMDADRGMESAVEKGTSVEKDTSSTGWRANLGGPLVSGRTSTPYLLVGK